MFVLESSLARIARLLVCVTCLAFAPCIGCTDPGCPTGSTEVQGRCIAPAETDTEEGAAVGEDGAGGTNSSDDDDKGSAGKSSSKPGTGNTSGNRASADSGAGDDEGGDAPRGGAGGKAAAGSGNGSAASGAAASGAAASGSDDMSGAGMGGASAGPAGAAGPKPPAPPMCGNGKVESGETCDGDCPTTETCPSSDPCLKPVVMGDAASCTAECGTMPVTKCAADDQCCPEGCTSVNDSDCSPSCGNKTKEEGETCDPASSCPSSCDDGDPCTTDVKTGTPGQCNVKCSHMPVKSPKNGDGCCPDGANANNDSDCSEECGNSVVEDGETCDPPGSCPSSCDDGDPCTTDPMMGSAASCSAACAPKVQVGAKTTSDRCCPRNTTLSDDPDCPAPTGWTVVEPGSCSGSTALKLHTGASVDCSGSPCKCGAPPRSNCRGGIAGPGGSYFIEETTCGGLVPVPASVPTGNIELASITSTPEAGGCELSGNGVGKINFTGEQTYCPVSTPRTTSCLTRSGDATCPAGYNSRKLLYKTFTGGGCTCTGCGVAAPGACSTWGYAKAGCSGDRQTGVAQGFAVLDANFSTLRVWVEETPATCKPATAQGLGDVKVTEPQTVCCP